MKADQVKAAVSARAGDHIAMAFDDLMNGASDIKDMPAAIKGFTARVRRIMGAEQAAIDAVDAVDKVETAMPREDDESLRARILDAGARGSVNEGRVLNAHGADLDEAATWYELKRRGADNDGATTATK